jgi:hypothetical protein
VNSGGPEALQTLRQLKLRPSRRDHGPALSWEAPAWRWFERLAEPPALGGAPRVPGAAWLDLCDRMGWDTIVAFELKAAIEQAYQDPQEAPRDRA